MALALLFAIPAAASTEKTLFNFSPWSTALSAAGANPKGSLLRDATGALNGTTSGGGDYYYGTVFKLTPPAARQTEWTLTILYSFTGGLDGECWSHQGCQRCPLRNCLDRGLVDQ